MKKRNIMYILLASMAVLALACNKQETPTGGSLNRGDGTYSIYDSKDFLLNRTNPLKEGDTIYCGALMSFALNNADADVYSFWSGAPNIYNFWTGEFTSSGADYEKRNEAIEKEGDENFVKLNNYGLPMTKKNGEFVREAFAYTTPGDFTITIVGRNTYDMGDSYTEHIEQINVAVRDSNTNLFGEGLFYQFLYYQYNGSLGLSPGQSAGSIEQMPNNEIQPCLNAANMGKANNVSFAIKAGRTKLFVDGDPVEVDNSKQWYALKNIDLSTTAKEIVVKAQSPGYERTYTLLPVVECTE
ncbi:MAG: hypothetical protein LBR55_07555 [Bacteroidales bacterium]|jgi:hypothetical protein|nr:hypothetical protein [Bacteroidales bacterium]